MKDKEKKLGQTEINIQANGKMVFSMGLEKHIAQRQEKKQRNNGEREKNGISLPCKKKK
jgi:hypothetical protein